MAGLAQAVKNARRHAAGGDKGNWTFSGAVEKAKELAPKLQRNATQAGSPGPRKSASVKGMMRKAPSANSAFQNAARSATQRDQQRTFPRAQNRK